MRFLKIITICLLIQTVLLTPVQALDFSDAFSQENISPNIYIQDPALQDVFFEKCKNDALFDALQENGWSITATARALGTYPSEIARKTSPEQIAKKKGEQRHVLKALIKNKFSLEKTKEELNIGRKKIIKLVGKEFIEQGRNEQRDKEIKIEKEMIVCALHAYRWNVSRASQETGIWKKRIYELIPSNIININRTIAEQELKSIIIQVLEDHGWNVLGALGDERLVEEEVGRYSLYAMFPEGWIDKQRQANIEKIAIPQKYEILAAINMFRYKRNCLRDVEAYLGLARGTLGDRMRKFGINIDNMRYDPDNVLPVLVKTKGNLTEAGKQLGLDRQTIGDKFRSEITQIKASGTYEKPIDQKQELLEAVEKFIDSRDWLAQVANELGLDEIQLKQRFREVKVNMYDIIYRPEIVLPVLVKTKGNVRSTCDLLGLGHEPISRRFKVEIAYIRQQEVIERKHAQELRRVVIPMLEQTNANVGLTAERLYLSESMIRENFEADIHRIYQQHVSILTPVQLLVESIQIILSSKNYSKRNDPETVVNLRGLKNQLRALVFPVLRQNHGDIEKTALVLGVDKRIISNLFTADIARIKNRTPQKREIIDMIDCFINFSDCLERVRIDLIISNEKLNYYLKKYKINIYMIRYSPKRVIPVLEKTGGNATQAAEILGLDRQLIRKRFLKEIKVIISEKEKLNSMINPILEDNDGDIVKVLKILNLDTEKNRRMFSAEIIKSKQMLAEKRKILAAINVFIKSKLCFKDVCASLDITAEELRKKLRKHKLNIEDIRYSKERVLPVLQTENGNASQAAKILNLNRQSIARRYPEYVQQKREDEYSDEKVVFDQNKAFVADVGMVPKLKLFLEIKQFINARDKSTYSLQITEELVAEYLGITSAALRKSFQEYNLNLDDIMYSLDRVFPVLEQTKGSFIRTADILGLDRDIIKSRFSDEISSIKIMVAEKREIIEEIEKIISKNDNESESVTDALAKAFKIPFGTMRDKLKKYGIEIYAVKYSRQRVMPVLLETNGNLTKTAEKLNLNRTEIKKRFAAELAQIKEMPDIVRMLYDFELLNKNLEYIMNRIDDCDSTNFISFCRQLEFSIYRYLKIIEAMERKTTGGAYPEGLLKKITFYKESLVNIVKILDCRIADDKFIKSLLVIVGLEIKGILNHRAFYLSDQIILMHGNRLSEAGQAEMLINNSI